MSSPSAFESGSVSQLFATPIWSFRPRNAAAIVQRVEAKLLALRAADPRHAAEPTAYWQSRPDLHTDAELGEVVALIDEAARAAMRLLEVDCQLRITGCWGNIGGQGPSLHDHTHPNNYLSGILYVKVPAGSGATSFRDPRPQSRVLRPRVLRDNPLNSTEFQYQGTAGTLLLFPAWLEHGVGANPTRDERLTVAFNLMVHGPLGSPELLAYSDL